MAEESCVPRAVVASAPSSASPSPLPAQACASAAASAPSPAPAPVLARYYTSYLTRAGAAAALFHVHSNQTHVSCLSPRHALVAALRGGGGGGVCSTVVASWRWAPVVAHLSAQGCAAAAAAGDKRSKRSQRAMVDRETVLATARTADGREWPLRAGVRGWVIELNDRLDEPADATALLRDAPAEAGWLAILSLPSRMRALATADAVHVADVAALDGAWHASLVSGGPPPR